MQGARLTKWLHGCTIMQRREHTMPDFKMNIGRAADYGHFPSLEGGWLWPLSLVVGGLYETPVRIMV